MKIIHIMGAASEEESPFADTYIVSYDPEFHHKTAPDGYGGGKLRVTADRSLATRFDVADALTLWKTGPSCPCHSIRPDGKPNRPLTAFTVSLEDPDA